MIIEYLQDQMGNQAPGISCESIKDGYLPFLIAAQVTLNWEHGRKL